MRSDELDFHSLWIVKNTFENPENPEILKMAQNPPNSYYFKYLWRSTRH
eukprot:SAG22_NODE_16921_length_313_cov_1.548837_1_plen_48_part_01